MCKCECEHQRHFSESSHHHDYGAKVESVTELRTDWGTFYVCLQCADECLADYAK